MRFFFLIILIEIAFPAYSQEDENKLFLDAYRAMKTEKHLESQSTLRELANHTKSNTIRIKCRTALAQYYTIYPKLDSAIFFSHLVLDEINGKQDDLSQKRKTIIYNSLGIAHQKKGEWDESIKWHIKGIETAEKVDFTRLMFQHTHGLAHSYMAKSEYDKARKLFTECVNKGTNAPLIYGSYINLGVLDREEGLFERSNANMRKAQELCEPYEDVECAVVTRINIAKNLSDLGRFTEAIKLLQEADGICKENNLNAFASNIRFQQGKIFYQIQELKQSRALMEESLRLALQQNNFEGISAALQELESIAMDQKDFKSAHTYLQQLKTLSDSIRSAQDHEKIRELEVKFFTVKKEKKIIHLQSQKAKKELELKNQKEAFRNLKLRKELEHQAHEHSIFLLKHDSIVSQTKIEKLTLEQKYNEEEISRQRNLRIAVSLVFVFFAILMFVLLRINRKKLVTQKILGERNEEISQQKIASILQKNELSLLQAEVQGENRERDRIARELHDSIGGNLAAIKLHLTQYQNSSVGLRDIRDRVNETYEQVREISHSLVPKKFQRTAFSSLIRSYVTSIQDSCDLTLNISIFPEQSINQLDNTYLIELYKVTQELITNTLKHAQASEVSIQINLFEGVVNLIYEDDGIGFNLKKAENGLGLSNIKRRVNTLKGSVDINSSFNRGVVFTIEIPTETYSQI